MSVKLMNKLVMYIYRIVNYIIILEKNLGDRYNYVF